ncbi:MAG: lytic transglycosylase domain-containing protein [Thermomicrobiales bacterium]
MTSHRGSAVVTMLLVAAFALGSGGVAGAAPIRGVSEADSGPTPTATTAPAVTPIPLPTPTEILDEGEQVRPKPSPRPFDNPAAQPEPTATPTVPPTPSPEPTPTGPPRLDHPVLRWLPEILNASASTGVAPELIAGVMQVESQGNPNIISPVGARGLMQVMPFNLVAMGFPEGSWHDPASNILAGAIYLAGNGVAAYFGFGCDVFGTCTDVYVSVVYGWTAYYAPIVANPYGSGFAILGPDWSPPPIAPFVEAAPSPIPTAPPTTPTPTPSATATSQPGETTTPIPEPTAPPTAIPTEPPTAVPTEPPTEVPTEPPTEVPTEPPAPEDPPPPEPPPPTDD